ncbi:MAG: hypothetical protein IJ905_06840 [Fibrobacter sp.]|nr:hypothetical protein [Fibrobacter sp.]
MKNSRQTLPSLLVSLSSLLALAACGDDSGSNSTTETSNVDLQVEEFDELPNCSKNRNGDIAEVLGERKAYVCDNGRWEVDHDILDSVKTEDDLFVCQSKNEGDSVWVTDESAIFVCSDRKWEKREIESSADSGSKKSASSSSKKTASSSSVKAVSSSTKKAESSSASKPSSSSKKVANSSSSSKVVVKSSDSKSSSSKKVESSSSASPILTGGGTCAPVKFVVEQGETVVWKYTVGGNVKAVDLLDAIFKWSTPGGTPESFESKGTVSVSDAVVYETSGLHSAKLVLSTSKETFNINCDPVQVNGAQITGCKCSTEAGSVDYTATPNVNWSVSGCTSGAGLELSYEWDGAAGAASYTRTFTTAIKAYAPKLMVKNSDNTMVEVECPSVKITEGPEFEIKASQGSGAIQLPKGTSRVVLNTEAYTNTVFCTVRREDSPTGALNGEINMTAIKGNDYVAVRMPAGELDKGAVLMFTLDVPATCGVQ